jgi:uncharacterized protein YkwD
MHLWIGTMRKQPIILILVIVLIGLAAGFWGCDSSKSPVPRTDSYGGEEPDYSLSDDEAELYEILDYAYYRETGRSLQIDGWLQAAARRMNWVLRRRGYGVNGSHLLQKVFQGDSATSMVDAPEAVPLASEAQYNIWIVGSTLAYPFVFTGLSAGFFDEFDADRLSWDDILGFGCNTVGIGVSKQTFPPGRWVTFLFAERAVIIDEFPKFVTPDSLYFLTGVMEDGYYNPKLLVTVPDGDVRQIDIMQHPSGEFYADVIFDGGPGQYLMEVACESPNGPRICGLFPVSAGRQRPESYPVWQSSGYQVYEVPDAAEEHLVRLINRDRERFQLPPVSQNSVLSQIARQYSREMRDGKFLAHVNPQGQDLKSRLAKRGIPYQHALENVSVGYSIEGIQAGLMNSPGHRRSILDPEVNQVGVGVVWTESGDPPRAYVTQVFVKTIERLDPETGREWVIAEINRRRKEEGLMPVTRNFYVEDLAEEYCKSIKDGNNDDVDYHSERDILEQFRLSGVPFQRVATLVKQVTQLEQILETDILYDSTYSWIGMGLCQQAANNEMASLVWATVILFNE